MRKLLAVVVPMYNIEDYLHESLDSLLKQGLSASDLQVILIDDGSVDHTVAVAKKYVKRYPDIFELHQFENGGLGAARNRGTRVADAKYITYVDPDDVIVENSYQEMLKMLSRTGSEIITGNVRRFNEKGKIWVPELHKRAILGDFEHTSLEHHPELIWDASSWNKIYDLEFLRENELYFPEGVLYEDFPMVNPAFAKAQGIDVMSRVVYMWRVRQGSITNKSTGAQATRDRIKVGQIALEGLNKFGAPKSAKKMLIQKSLNMGILAMLRKEKYELIPEDDRIALFSELKTYLKLIPSEYLDGVSFDKLVYFTAVLDAKNIKDFDDLSLKYLRNEVMFSGNWENDVWVLHSDISKVKKIANDADLDFYNQIQKIEFDYDTIHIWVDAYAEFGDMSSKQLVNNLSVTVLDENNNEVIKNFGVVSIKSNKNITAKYGYNDGHFAKDGADFNYDYSVFKISVPLSAFSKLDGELTLRLNAQIDNIELSTILGHPVSRPETHRDVYVSEDQLLAVQVDYDSSDWTMRIRIQKEIALLKYVEGQFKIENSYNDVYLQQGNTKLNLKKLGNTILFPVSVVERLSQYEKEARGDWRFMTKNADKVKPIYFAQKVVSLPHKTFFRTLNAKLGHASMEVTWYYPKITKISIDHDILSLDFQLFGWEKEAKSITVIADPDLPDVEWTPEKMDIDKYHLSIPLTLSGFAEKPWLNFEVKLEFEDGYLTSQGLKWGDEEFSLEDAQISAANVEWEFHRTKRDFFAIKRTADLTYRLELGSFDRFVETEYAQWLEQPILDNVIVWSAYWGRDNKFNGNPRALYEYVSSHYSKYRHVIVVKNVIRDYPEFGNNTQVISFGTKEYWYYLARGHYFVNDVNFTEKERVKRPEQIEIQTMHGTPLKTMGFDVLDEWQDSTYNTYLKRFRSYDYLVATSDWAGNYAKKAFKIDPIVLKTGYPRNDYFFNEQANEDGQQLRLDMGFSPETKVLLYAPTWREKDLGHTTSLNRLVNVEALYNSLPENTVVLIKGHNFQPLAEIPKQYRNKIILAPATVTIEKLYMVADAVITDYSSVMFDFALLNKPMIFWAFDYEEYMTNRGMNFDLMKDAPGPVVQKQEELEKWILNVDMIQDTFAKRIENFRNKFNQYENGHASEKIATQVFGEPE